MDTTRSSAVRARRRRPVHEEAERRHAVQREREWRRGDPGAAQRCGRLVQRAAALALVTGGAAFDVAILDMDMPDMDGRMLASALRAVPAGRDLPLLLLSSLQTRLPPEHRALFIAALTKPAKSQLLRERLLEALAPTAAAMASVETTGGRRQYDTPAPDQRPLRILLAEDNVVNQKVARLMLTKLGHHVDTVSNGLEAVSAVHRARYDVVLMDVQMPELDGLAATDQIRSSLPASRQPRIAAMTASVLVEDRTACAAAGMDDYLSKPVRAAELAAMLTHLTGSPGPALDRSRPATERRQCTNTGGASA